jgi:hypothetical protein
VYTALMDCAVCLLMAYILLVHSTPHLNGCSQLAGTHVKQTCHLTIRAPGTEHQMPGMFTVLITSTWFSID